MKKMFNEGNKIHNFISISGSGTVTNYGSGSGSDFLTRYGSGYGSGSTSQKVTVPTVPVPQHCLPAKYSAPHIMALRLTCNITLFTVTAQKILKCEAQAAVLMWMYQSISDAVKCPKTQRFLIKQTLF